jgi:hypothetical protein
MTITGTHLAYRAAEISFGRGAFITETIPALPQQIDLNFADVKSQDSVKPAPEIAAVSGDHNGQFVQCCFSSELRVYSYCENSANSARRFSCNPPYLGTGSLISGRVAELGSLRLCGPRQE